MTGVTPLFLCFQGRRLAPQRHLAFIAIEEPARDTWRLSTSQFNARLIKFRSVASIMM